jgi:GNAT superfamily N-acetyltransferase
MSALDFTRVTDEDGLRDYHRILAESFEADFEALPVDPIECLRPGLSGQLNGEEIEFWTGRADGEPGACLTIRYSARDNLDLATVAVDVHPSMRRRGIGRAGADACLERVRELGRSRVLGEVPTRTRHLDPAPAEHLAKAMGARPLLLERRRLLDIGALDWDRVAAVAAAAAQRHRLLDGDLARPHSRRVRGGHGRSHRPDEHRPATGRDRDRGRGLGR